MKLILQMKYLLFLILLLFSNCAKNEKNTKSGSLKVDVEYCKYSDKSPSLRNYKILQNGIEFKEIKWKKNELIVLPFGIYEIEYKNIFNQLEIAKVIINKSLVNTTLCIDKINFVENKNILLIDELNINETMEYRYKSKGCFSTDQNKLFISRKKNNEYYAKYKDIEYQLSKKQFQFIREFEIELRSNYIGGCSTVDEYAIYNGQSMELYTVNDASCMWRGFPNLIEILEIDKN